MDDEKEPDNSNWQMSTEDAAIIDQIYAQDLQEQVDYHKRQMRQMYRQAISSKFDENGIRVIKAELIALVNTDNSAVTTDTTIGDELLFHAMVLKSKNYSVSRIYEYIYETSPRCICEQIMEECMMQTQLKNSALKCIKYLLALQLEVPTCRDVVYTIQYENLERHMPTLDQLTHFVNQNERIESNAMDFYEPTKSVQPASGLEHVKKYVRKIRIGDERQCSMCQSNFKKNDTILQLPQCRHMFHYYKRPCLLQSSVIDWFKINNQCPICRVEACFD